MLKCPEHPGQKWFMKVSIVRVPVHASSGQRANSKYKPAWAKPATYQTIYVCPVCDDIVEQTPVVVRRDAIG